MLHKIRSKTGLTTLLLSSFVLVLAGCKTTAGSCAWIKKPPVPNNSVELVVKERKVAEYLATSEAFGKEMKCWN